MIMFMQLKMVLSEGYTNEKEGKYSFDVESYEIKKL